MSEFAPMDILGKKFTKKLHGYAELEVHEYLTELARVMEGLLRERGELRQRVHHMEQELSGFRERESALKEALVAAQRSAETTIEVARVEGQRIVGPQPPENAFVLNKIGIQLMLEPGSPSNL